MLRPALAGLAVAVVLSVAPGAAQQQPASHQVLGRVNFPVQCNAAAQAEFNHGMLLQHSFWYAAAAESFRQVRRDDPACVMSYWGEALTLITRPNPYLAPVPANLRQGRALLEEARRVGAQNPRETA